MLAWALTLVVAGSGVVEQPSLDLLHDRARILVMDLSVSGSASDEEEAEFSKIARLFDGSIAEALSRAKSLDVVTVRDIAQIATLEAEKAAAACEATTCMTEVASALGARFVLYGQATRVDGIYVLQLTLLDTGTGLAVARRQVTGIDALDASDGAKRGVALMTESLLAEGDEGFAEFLAPDEPPPAFPLLSVSGGVVLGLGATAAVTGGVLLAIADPVFRGEGSLERRLEAQSLGQTGIVTMVGGGVVALVGAGLLAYGLVAE